MIAVRQDAEGSTDAIHKARRWWSSITALLALGLFAQAAFAGAMLSGDDWARPAHAGSAFLLIAAILIAGLGAAVRLRHIAHGPRLALTLLSLALLVAAQTALGKLAAQGQNLMWAHVPLGVALVGLAGQAAAMARRLGAGEG